MNNLFELAAINKVRFASSKGNLTVEQLYDLNIQSQTKSSLESIANGLAEELATMSSGSALGIGSNIATAGVKLKLDIVKAVYAHKLAVRAAKTTTKANDTRRTQLEALRDKKILAKDDNLSEAEIAAELASLG